MYNIWLSCLDLFGGTESPPCLLPFLLQICKDTVYVYIYIFPIVNLMFQFSSHLFAQNNSILLIFCLSNLSFHQVFNMQTMLNTHTREMKCFQIFFFIIVERCKQCHEFCDMRDKRPIVRWIHLFCKKKEFLYTVFYRYKGCEFILTLFILREKIIKNASFIFLCMILLPLSN